MAKVKTKFGGYGHFKRWQTAMKAALPKFMKTEIIDESILKGKSPVKPGEKYDEYSESYKKQIRTRYTFKRISPVNLKLTGQMLDSFTTSVSGNKLRISFSDKKAKYHNDGNSKLPQRKMLPTRTGERFTRTIELNLYRLAEEIFKLTRRR